MILRATEAQAVDHGSPFLILTDSSLAFGLNADLSDRDVLPGVLSN
jgi:hypothetical protein